MGHPPPPYLLNSFTFPSARASNLQEANRTICNNFLSAYVYFGFFSLVLRLLPSPLWGVVRCCVAQVHCSFNFKSFFFVVLCISLSYCFLCAIRLCRLVERHTRTVIEEACEFMWCFFVFNKMFCQCFFGSFSIVFPYQVLRYQFPPQIYSLSFLIPRTYFLVVS